MKVNSETLYELINDGTIKENTKFEVYRDDIYITVIEFDGYDFNWDSGCFTSGMFYDPLVEFKEIIEEEKEIEEIKVIKDDNCKRYIEYDDETGHHKYVIRVLDEYFSNKINELVKEIKALKNK